jgi:hypothetical protein
MTVVQAWIGHLGTVVLAVVLAGVIARRRYRIWYSFAVFLVITLSSAVLIMAWPARFYTQEFWRAKETAFSVLRFATALELAYRVFRSFPGAITTLRWALFFVSVATLVAVIAASTGGTDYRAFLAEMQPRVLYGSIWLFTAIAALILWYRLPVDPFQKAVLLSYVPFLLIFTVTVNAMGSRVSEQLGDSMRYLYQIAYLALIVHWARAAWRRTEAPARPPEVRPPTVRPPVREPLSA